MENILKSFIKVAENEGIKITQLEKNIGASKGVLSRAIANNSDIQAKWFLKLVENYPKYNFEWLITGKGNMLKEDHENLKIISSNRKTQDPNCTIQEIPLYDLEATAGLKELFASGSPARILDTIKIPNLPKCDGAITVTGDSMYPLLKAGDMVAYKKIDVDIDNIFFGEIYILALYIDQTSTMKTIKFVQKSEKGDDYIKLVSQNPHHADKDIRLNQIAAMGLVRASIRLHN